MNFHQLFILFLLLIIVQANKERKCKGMDSNTYSIGESYTKGCTTYVCERVRMRKRMKKMKMVKKLSINCCKYNGQVYQAGQHPSLISGNSTTGAEVETVLTHGNCCNFNGKVLHVGERVALPEKYGWIVCNQVKTNTAQEMVPTIQVDVRHDSNDTPGNKATKLKEDLTCKDEYGQIHQDGNVIILTSKEKVECCKGRWMTLYDQVIICANMTDDSPVLKCPENSGCFNDEVGLYGRVGEFGFCQCFLGFFFDSSTQTCVDMRGGGNCDKNKEGKICFESSDEKWEFCPFCSVKKEDISLGNYISGEGDYPMNDPQLFNNGSSENCSKPRSIEVFFECWYDVYPDQIVPLDSIILGPLEPDQCEFLMYVYTPLACCFADPETKDADTEC